MTDAAPRSAVAAGDGVTLRSAYALGVLTLIYSLNYLDRSILSLVLPQLQRDIHLSDTEVGLVAGFAFVLFYSLAGVPIARLADRSSRRNIIAVGVIFWSFMTSLTGLVANVWQLAATRFLMGAGEACGTAPSNSMVADMFSEARRPMALAVLSAGSSLAYLAFFPIAGWITQEWGWRTTFLLAGVPGLVLGVLLLLTVKEPQRRRVERRPSGENFSQAMRYLYGSRTFALAVIGGCFMGVSLYAASTWNPMFLVRVHEFDIAQVGMTLGPLRGFGGLVGVLLGGFLADRLGRKDPRWRLLLPGIACLLVLPLELIFLLSPNVPIALAALGGAHLFSAAHIGPIYAACMSVAGADLRTTAAAMYLFFANMVGQILGPLIVGYLNDVLHAEFGDLSIRYSLIIGAICAAIAGVAFLLAAPTLGNDTRRAEGA